MGTAAIVDFWRRRRIFIILGLIGLCLVVVFIRARPLKSHKNTGTQGLAKNSEGKAEKGKAEKNKNRRMPHNPNHVRPLPPIINKFKDKNEGRRKLDKGKGFVKDADKLKDMLGKNKPDNYEDDDYGDFLGGDRKGKDGGAKDDVKGERNGEAPLDRHSNIPRLPDKPLIPEEEEEVVENMIPNKPVGKADQLDKLLRKRPDQEAPDGPGRGNQIQPGGRNHPGNVPNQPGNGPNQPGNVPNQPGNRPNQPGNGPNQPGNHPYQPDQPRNQPYQPGNGPNQPGNHPYQPDQPRNGPKQPGNQPYQPGNGPNQPGNQPSNGLNQPGNQPYQPGNGPNQPGNQLRNGLNQPYQPRNGPNQPGNQPYQPRNEPRNEPENQGPNQPGNRNGHDVLVDSPNQPGNGPSQPDILTDSQTDSASLYVHSSMPLGRPLNSRRTERQQAVVEAFKYAWKPYKLYAWGKDEVNPISRSPGPSSFNMGMTLVDCLDTLWLMGLEAEFQEAREWVEMSLNIDGNKNTVSLFETNIRVLGGLLSAYHLSGDRVFLDKATTLGTHLLPAFDTPSGIPSNVVSLSGGRNSGRSITTAEAGTLQLEFRDLSRASGNPAFQKACDRDMDKILSQESGIVRQSLNCNSGLFSGSLYSAGAGIDSYYEYLLKQWIQSSMTENKFREAYERSVKGVLDHLVGYSQPSHMAFLGKRFSLSSRQPPSSVMDHLSCFYPGMLALGNMYQLLPNTRAMAENLTHTCYYMYNSTSPTGLAPEIFQFNTNPQSTSDSARSLDSQNLQRPETVESLFYLYRLTKDEKYRDWGWRIFQAFEKYTKLETGGYASLRNVYTPGKFRDRTESFFLTETLKYLYLLFEEDDTVLSLKEWVFNTEAHPLPIWREG